MPSESSVIPIEFPSSRQSTGKGWGSGFIIDCRIIFMWGLGLHNYTANLISSMNLCAGMNYIANLCYVQLIYE